MASFNKAIIMGNLTRDPELKYTPQGTAVCELGLALNRKYTNKTTNQKVEEVSYIDVVCWGKTAEVAAEYLKKGRQVHVEGYLKQDRWENPEGKKMSKIRVVAENIVFVGSKPQGGEGGAPAEAGAEVGAGGPEDQGDPF